MTTLISSPNGFAPEEWLRVDLSGTQGGEGGPHLVVVSGYAQYNGGVIIGDEDADNFVEDYLLEILVGPIWLRIRDVAPIATVAGYYHQSPDTVDKIGYHVESCTWELPEAPEVRKIRLKVAMQVWGGADHSIERIAYHLVARGMLAPGQDFKETS